MLLCKAGSQDGLAKRNPPIIVGAPSGAQLIVDWLLKFLLTLKISFSPAGELLLLLVCTDRRHR